MKTKLKIPRMAIVIVALVVVAYACSDNESQQLPADVDLDELPWVESRSALEVSLWTASGEEVSENSPLKPETSYKLKVESSNPLSLKVKFTDGFTIEGCDQSINSMTKERIFLIKTAPDVPENLYVNFVPLLTTEDGLIRERPQAFLLPKQSLNF